MLNDKKMYKKKYGNVGFKKFAVIFLSLFIFVIIAFPEYITNDIGAIAGLLMAAFILIICVIDLIFTNMMIL